jgi:hypothetical protein
MDQATKDSIGHMLRALAAMAVLAASPGCDNGKSPANGVAPPDTIECHTCSDTSSPAYCTKTIWTMKANGDDCTQLTFEPDDPGKP